MIVEEDEDGTFETITMRFACARCAFRMDGSESLVRAAKLEHYESSHSNE